MPQLLIPVNLGAIFTLHWYWALGIVFGLLLIPCILAECLKACACSCLRFIFCKLFCCCGSSDETKYERVRRN